ncbi:hypothetical protein F2Q69_00052755 [Brassica cretica]|uniref:Uncharacterized protein n=1 Tax=Brassica cretica TaxID=69181 RepID=A0A8S9N586_BRACR|nr:hypothetical protein F2Q69_00052755 [Brassica cretica]
MVLIFHSFKGFSDLDLDTQVFQIWKTSGLEDFQTSRRLPGSLPGDFQRLPESLPDDFQKVFQTTSRKSSRRLPGSLLPYQIESKLVFVEE